MCHSIPCIQTGQIVGPIPGVGVASNHYREFQARSNSLDSHDGAVLAGAADIFGAGAGGVSVSVSEDVFVCG